MPAAMPPKPPLVLGPTANPESIRWYVELLVQMILDYSNQAVKFLSLANSGGAIALLSFMGNSEPVRSMPSTWSALTYLIVGFVLAGLVAVINFFSAMYLGRRFGNRAQAFYRGQLAFPDLFHTPTWFRWSLALPILAGAASLACFARASWLAIEGYSSLVR